MKKEKWKRREHLEKIERLDDFERKVTDTTSEPNQGHRSTQPWKKHLCLAFLHQKSGLKNAKAHTCTEISRRFHSFSLISYSLIRLELDIQMKC